MADGTGDQNGETKKPSKSERRARRTLASAKRGAKSNRLQKILFGVLTILLTVAAVGLARYLIRPTTLVFAVSPKEGVEMNFAKKLETLLVQNNLRIRIKIAPVDTIGQAMTDFAQAKADLAIGRTDQRLPSSARSIAILDRAVLIAILPKGSKVKTVEGLKGKRIAIINNDARDPALVRSVMKIYELSANTLIEERSADDLAHIFEPAGNAPAVAIMILRRSSLSNNKALQAFAHKPGFELLELEEVKAIEGRLNSVKSETVEAGLVSVKPSIPKDDVETVAVDELLLARAKVSTSAISDLTRAILENKEELALEGAFATAIQPPDTDKDARIFVHRGAAEYVNDDTKSFMDRYSDYFYLGLTVMSGIGTLFVTLYTTLTRTPPIRSSELTDEVMEVSAKIRDAQSLREIEAGEAQLDHILMETMSGIRDGSISTKGFEPFRLAFECALGLAAARRMALGIGDGDRPSTLAQQAVTASFAEMIQEHGEDEAMAKSSATAPSAVTGA